MAITEEQFNDENELEEWTFANIQTFFGDCILLRKFRITTPSGKHGIPDGFVFNLKDRYWWVEVPQIL